MLDERRRIIQNEFPSLHNNEIDQLSHNTRGLRKGDIEKVVKEYILTGCISYTMNHPTNTCDPYTGSWTEKIIDLRELLTLIRNYNLKVGISNSYYAYSGNRILNVSKYIINQIIRILGPGSLIFSPTYTSEIEVPSSQLRGIFDPQIGILFFMLANPAASSGECARGDSKNLIEYKISYY